MAAVKPSGSPAPVPAGSGPRNRVAEALYEWCRENQDVGHVFNQNELLQAGVIPDQDLRLLLDATNDLVKKHLFRIHDFKQNGGIGWELISQERAANYEGLTRDEHLVFSCIDSMGTAGIWTKTIKTRLQAHAKVLERVYKSLEARGLIKPMKSVKNPGRKMFIVATLQPSEEATGGAWFTEGTLDVGLMDTVSEVIEHFVSKRSWHEVEAEDYSPPTPQTNNKRKAPAKDVANSNSNSKGKSKAARLDDERPRSESPELHKHKSKPKPTVPKSYTPFEPGHQGYPTLKDITREIMRVKVTATVLPETAIQQLLSVMVYDDRLFRVKRKARAEEIPDDYNDDDEEDDTVTMYRCFKTPSDLAQRHHLERRKISYNDSTRKAAFRQQELEDIGQGGSSEVPCLRCPVFDICGEGGPVNVNTCVYFDQWYQNMEEADHLMGDVWPGSVKVDEELAVGIESIKDPPVPAATAKAGGKESIEVKVEDGAG